MRSVLALFFIAGTFICHAQNKQYTFVFLNKNPAAEKLSKEESERIMSGHMANINKLAEEGKLLAAGPFEGGGGMFVLNTTDKDEASQWLKDDPGVQAKRWNIELLPFTLHGSLCKVSAPYEMVMYSFARFDAIVSKYTSATYPEIIQRHNQYVEKLAETGNVVASGTFGQHDGGIVIMKGEVQKDIFEQDPGVQEGLLELTMKQLYIAKGSFCEK